MEDSICVPLTKGQFAIVDSVDFAWISAHKWRAQWSRKTKSYYAARSGRRVLGEKYVILMHREILGIDDPRIQVDHRKPCATLDNRRLNLRIATPAQNAMNKRSNKPHPKGTWFHQSTKKWRASIWIEGKNKHLGCFPTAETASEAYRVAAVSHFGEFARSK